MKLTSRSIQHNKRVPKANVAGVPGPNGPEVGPNKSPHLAWSEFPAKTKSFAIICHDPDAPSKADDVNKPDRAVPYDLPRIDFFHWILLNIPLSVTELAEGLDSDGFTSKGKKPGKTSYGLRGVNTYTDWFGGDPNMSGDYGGYDGPWPPFNDERLHHYHFAVYALGVPSINMPEKFKGPDARKAIEGHVLDKATIMGTYAINPTARE